MLLLDPRMPNGSGSDVYRQLRHEGRQTPVVLVTAASNIGELASSMGVERYLRKPFGAEELRHEIDRAAAARTRGADEHAG